MSSVSMFFLSGPVKPTETTTTFEFKTRKGLAEGAIAYELGRPTLWDRLRGRERVNFGVGLCSPRDRNERQVIGYKVNFSDLTGGPIWMPVHGDPLYVPG